MLKKADGKGFNEGFKDSMMKYQNEIR